MSAALPPTNYADDHAKRITSAEVVGTLGEDMFGEQVNFYTGATTFTHTDLEVPGNSSLPFRVGRRFIATGSKVDPYANALGDWELDVPYMSGTYPADRGWQVSTQAPDQRCSTPQTAAQAVPPAHTHWHGYEFWHGNSLYVPGSGEQTVLFKKDSLPGAPEFNWITKDFWLISCTPTIIGGPGEGFIATAPDGTKYTFNRLATRRSNNSAKRDGAEQFILQRNEVRLYATRVVDRFGNWVSYNWEGSTPASVRLSSITAGIAGQVSGGQPVVERTLTFHYQGAGLQIESVTDGTRTIRYEYTAGSLTKVIYPDESAWTLNMTNANPGGPESGSSVGDWSTSSDDTRNCAPNRGLKTDEGSASLTHPSGAQGLFDFRYRRHFRPGVPDEFCNWGSLYAPDGTNYHQVPPEGGEIWEFTSSVPRSSDVLAIKRKRIIAVASPTAEWNYDYPVDSQSPTEPRVVIVHLPESNRLEYRFGRIYNVNEGQLLETSLWWSGNTVEPIRATRYEYATQANGYPDRPGISPNFSLDVFQVEKLRPQTSETIRQEKVDFVRFTAEDKFNEFAKPLQVRRSAIRSDNSVLGDKLEAITYEHQKSIWLINLPKTLAVGTPTGSLTTISNTTYFPATHAAKGLPQFQDSYGQRVATYSYHTGGLLASVADARNFYTYLNDYYRGVPRRVSMPNGAVWQAQVSPIGRITQSTDPLNNTSFYGYDLMGRLSQITYPAENPAWTGKTFTFRPDGPALFGLPAKHWRHTTTHGSYRKEVHYDGYWRPVVTREWDDNNSTETTRTVVRHYDGLGREKFVSFPMATLTTSWNAPSIDKGTHSSFDALGRLRRVEQRLSPNASESLYTQIDYTDGFVKEVINPRLARTKYSFQAFDQPDESAPTWIKHPENVETQIQRDLYGKPLSMTRSGTYAGAITTATRYFVYDAQQRLCKQINPESGASVFGYDAANNQIWSAEGRSLPSLSCDGFTVPVSQRTSRSYDPVNRLTGETYPDASPSIHYEYALDGLPTRTWTSQGVEWRYGYNKRRLPTYEEYESGEIMRFVFGYDSLGHLSSVTHPGGLRIDHQPNALGQPSRAGTLATGVKYYPSGLVKEFSYGNGIKRTNTPTPDGLLARTQDLYAPTANYVLDFEYRYDANRNLDYLTDRSTGQAGMQTRGMSYDLLDRLTSASGGGLPNARYAYDPLDNLREADLGPRRYDYIYDPGTWRLGSIRQRGGGTMWSFGYDTRGASIAKGTQGYAFDAAQRLLSVPDRAEYYYDAEGRRIGQSRSDGFAKYSLYTRDGLQRGGPDNRLSGNNWQIYLGRQLVATVFEPWGSTINQTTYHHTDLLGSSVADTNSSRAVTARTYYTPYGEAQNRTVDGPGYTSHVADGNTGLVYMQQRYYDPIVGRFLSRDPVGVDAASGGNFNRYWYANNNPYTFTDPDGRLPIFIPIAIAAVSLMTHSNYANAPAPGEATMSLSSGEHFEAAMSALPPGRLMAGVKMMVNAKQTHTTYTREKPDGTVYSGRTRGTGTPEQQVAARTSRPDHQAKTAEGYGPATVDRNSPNPDAIRGREQQLIERNGGAQSQGGTSGNAINGVSPTNPKAEQYQRACTAEFGCN